MVNRSLILNVNRNGNVDVLTRLKTRRDTFTSFITTASSWNELIRMGDFDYPHIVVRHGETMRPFYLRLAEAYDND